MNIECLERGGKIHVIKSELDDGTHIMVCGLAQQKSFKSSIIKFCCYGEWIETEKPATCKKCKSITNNRRHINEFLERIGEKAE